MKPQVPEHIRALEPYRPGKPIEEVERELGIPSAIKLASNENALGPSPAVVKVLRDAAASIHRYPDGPATMLRRRIAAKLAVAPEQILLGNGSNELIELIARVFVQQDAEVIFSDDAFLIYDIVTRACRGVPVRVPPVEHCHDLDGLAAAITARTKVIFLANPNNPSGTIFRRDAWRRFLQRVPSSVVVVVDQAYYEYVDDPEYPDAREALAKHPGLVVLHTFSKAYGLAGLRIGYGVGPVLLIDALARLRAPFSVNSLAQVAALAAIDDEAHLERSRQLVREGRRAFARRLETLGLRYVPSQANFVLIDVGDGGRVSEQLLRRGVIVRPMAAYRLESMIRVTFGTAEENFRCLDALAEVMGEIE